MKKKFLLLIAFLLIFINFFSLTSSAVTEIASGENEENFNPNLYFNAIVDSRKDGTLDINFDITCKLIKSSESISWIKIEFPASNIDEIVGISDNIDEIRYFKEKDSNYIRINLDRNYSKGDILNLKYSLHYLYDTENKEKDSYFIDYSYIIDNEQFSDIYVDKLTLFLNSENILEVPNSPEYYAWDLSFNKEESHSVSVKYFVDEECSSEVSNQSSEELSTIEKVGIVLAIVLIIMLVILILLAIIDLIF